MSPDAIEALALAIFIELDEGQQYSCHADYERLEITLDDCFSCRELAARIIRRLNLQEKQ